MLIVHTETLIGLVLPDIKSQSSQMFVGSFPSTDAALQSVSLGRA